MENGGSDGPWSFTKKNESLEKLTSKLFLFPNIFDDTPAGATTKITLRKSKWMGKTGNKAMGTVSCFVGVSTTMKPGRKVKS